MNSDNNSVKSSSTRSSKKRAKGKQTPPKKNKVSENKPKQAEKGTPEPKREFRRNIAEPAANNAPNEALNHAYGLVPHLIELPYSVQCPELSEICSKFRRTPGMWGHPISGAFRSLAACLALQHATEDMVSTQTQHLRIVDVGGNFNNNRQMRLNGVWTLNPSLTYEKVARNLVSGYGSCNHYLHDCTCGVFASSYSVHSLYYVLPQELADHLKWKVMSRTHYAVVHRYMPGLNTFNKLKDMSTKYDNGIWTTMAEGNSVAYKHESNSWMFQRAWRGEGKSGMAITVLGDYNDHWLIKFFYTDVLPPALLNPWQRTVAKVAHEPSLSTALLPYVEMHCAGLDRSKESAFRSFISAFPQALARDNIDLFNRYELAINKMELLTTVYHKALESEVKIRQDKFQPFHPTQNQTIRSINKFEYNHDSYLLRIMIVIWSVVGLYFLALALQNKIDIFLVPLITCLIIAITVFCVALAMGYVSTPDWMNKVLPLVLGRAYSFFSLPDRCCPAPLLDMDPTAELRVPSIITCDIRTIMTNRFLVVPSWLPTLPRNCYHSIMTAIRNRCIRHAPVEAGAWDDMAIPTEILVAAKSFSAANDLLSEEEWAARYGTTRREKLYRDLDYESLSHHTKPGFTTGFIKKEKYLGKQEFSARLIQASTAFYNVTVGPWITSLSTFIANIFNYHHPVFFYATKTSAEEIGSWFSDSAKRFPYIIDSDFSSFDSTISWQAIVCEMEVYSAAGFPLMILLLLRLQTVTQGKVKGGWKFSCKGKRGSGRPNTSLGNTLLNFILFWNYCQRNGIGFRMMALGDDTVAFTNKPIDLVMMKEYYKQKGFLITPTNRTVTTAEFCSCLFYPFGDSYILGPKIGRVLAKTFWEHNGYNERKYWKWVAEICIGMQSSWSFVPVLREVSLRYTGADTMIKSEYQHYASKSYPVDDRTYPFLCERYGLTFADIDALVSEVSGIAPVVLQGPIVERICQVDIGGKPNVAVNELRYHCTQIRQFNSVDIVVPVIEEVIKSQWWWLAFMIGFYECDFNFSEGLVHSIIHVMMSMLPLPVAICLHLCLNWSVRHFNNNASFNMARKKSKTNKTKKPTQPKQAKNDFAEQLAKLVKTGVKTGLISGGAALGGMVGMPSLGAAAGGWLSKAIGSGDYKISNNSLMASGVPTFSGPKNSVRIRHRELISDISGSTAFTNNVYPINPGLAQTFPWFSQICGCFTSYRIWGMMFEFLSNSADALNSTNTAMGSVIMATQYNVTKSNYVNKPEMAASEFSCATKPSESLLHPIECDLEFRPIRNSYLRSGTVPSGEDKRFYDWGNFQLATVGMQAAAVIGELWVTYDIELFYPKLIPGEYPGTWTTVINNGAYTSTDILSSVQTTPTGLGGITIKATGAGYDTIFFPSDISSGVYFVSIRFKGSSTVYTAPTITRSNCALINTTSNAYGWELGASGSIWTPASGATASAVTYQTIVSISGYSSAGSYIQLSGGTLPSSGTAVDIYVEPLPLDYTP